MKPVTLYDSKAVARFLDVSERRVRQLRDEGIIAVSGNSKNLYSRDEATVQYINFLRRKNADNGENIDYNAERAKLIRAKRLNEEYDLKVKERELHSAVDIEAAVVKMLTDFKTKLMNLPATLAPKLARKTDRSEISAILRNSIYAALTELSTRGGTLFEITEERETDDEEEDG